MPPPIRPTPLASGARPEAETVSVSIGSTTSDIVEEGRFVAGTLLGGRYRVIGLLGRGGMGEVYRATDLTLGQAVALKFLPEAARSNQRVLERFHGEVRIARLVSHPNVCRVYDIGEVEGMPFLSMEYVDGEDLSSLLLRIGRLPAAKALETARKLCAGLAAAHDRGVIHRDLKPQNIMINRRGEVVIMDFGLAAIAHELSGPEARNGTPAYMAPEQLKGSGVTTRSDIYALGLVLYELFTGKRPYSGETLQQLLDQQEAAQLTSMTSIASEIDPAVEKVIRRCLEPDPLKRPASALAVSAALPGGDALAAALAAGETPSPEIVANAGKTEGLERRYSIPCLVFVALSLLGAILAYEHTFAMNHTALVDSPDVMAHRSRELAALFGYPDVPADFSITLAHRDGLVDYLKRLPGPLKWDQWLAVEAPIRTEYRESPNLLNASPYGLVDTSNPPPTAPGMVAVSLDGHGRLLTFDAVPYGPGKELAQPIPVETVFQAAKLDLAKFTETAPNLLPPAASDEVQAWKGPHPDLPNTELTVQIASWKGRITQARVEYPWSRPDAASEDRLTLLSKARNIFQILCLAAATLVVALMARRNWKKGRSDRRGALRVAAARLVLAGVGWAGLAHFLPSADTLSLILAAAGGWLLSAALVWTLYLALEPEVRARWPHALVTWNRLLAGQWLDAQVGAHILLGATVGCALWAAGETLTQWGGKSAVNASGALLYTLGTRQWLGAHARALGVALTAGLMVFLAIFGIRQMVRKNLLAAVITAAMFTMTESEVVHSADWVFMAAVYMLLYTALIFVLLRLGLVSTMAAIYFINSFNALTLGGDWKSWYTPAGLATLFLMLGITLFAFWRSLGSRELLGGEGSPA